MLRKFLIIWVSWSPIVRVKISKNCIRAKSTCWHSTFSNFHWKSPNLVEKLADGGIDRSQMTIFQSLTVFNPETRFLKSQKGGFLAEKCFVTVFFSLGVLRFWKMWQITVFQSESSEIDAMLSNTCVRKSGLKLSHIQHWGVSTHDNLQRQCSFEIKEKSRAVLTIFGEFLLFRSSADRKKFDFEKWTKIRYSNSIVGHFEISFWGNGVLWDLVMDFGGLSSGTWWRVGNLPQLWVWVCAGRKTF